MAKKDVSAIVSGAGLLTAIWTELVNAVRERGGTDEDIHRLSTPAGRETVDKMADCVVQGKSAVANTLSDWQNFYAEVFGLMLDFSGLRIPEKRDGFNRLIIVAEGMTPNRLYDKCAELFPGWKYADNLDQITSDRKADHDYAIWVRDRQEADEELKNKSANTLEKEGVSSATLEERLLYELKFFIETRGKTGEGKHLDVSNWTLCAGSRYPGGGVPFVSWGGDGVRVGWCGPGDRHDDLRARVAVS